jgi:hypothetical protein
MRQDFYMRVFYPSTVRTTVKLARNLIYFCLLCSFGVSQSLSATPKAGFGRMSEYRMSLQWQFTRGQSKESVRIDSVSENYSSQVLISFLNPHRCSLTLPNKDILWASCNIPDSTTFADGQQLLMRIEMDEREFVGWLGLGQEFSSVASGERQLLKAKRVTLSVWKATSKSLETLVKADDEMSSLILRVHAHLIPRMVPSLIPSRGH